MKNTTLSTLIVGLTIGSLSSLSSADVQSLSTSELTETYIKDSTIIVTPKKQQAKTEKKTYSSLTIAPVTSVDQDFDKLEHLDNHMDSTFTSVMLDENDLRNAGVASALAIPLEPTIPDYYERNELTMAEVMNDERYAVPEGNFERVYMGGNANSLGVSRNGDQVTFSIGNLPQINQIELPHAVDEGPLQITPRANGGFDLTINIPQDN